MTKRKALGKGLSALIPEAQALIEEEMGYFSCPVDLIDPNPLQPRRDFSESELKEMAQSVREMGVLTPLLVSKKGERYQLIAGERRLRAAKIAGVDRVPVVVREVSPVESLEMAIVENIHRKDLNPIEEAEAYQRLLEELKITQEALAQRVGKDRATIANLLRLLKLPPPIQKDLIEGRLTMGHARALAGVKGQQRQLALRELVIEKGLSVRELEKLIRSRAVTRRKKEGTETIDYYVGSLAEDLKRSLGTKVEIKRRGSSGKIIIHFYSDEELDRLLERLT